MELINAGFEIIEQEPGLQGIYKAIEIPGRLCYRSMILPDGAERFVHNILEKSNHGAPMEHGTVYLKFDGIDNQLYEITEFYEHNPYSKVKMKDGVVYITSNYRVLFENKRLDDLKYLCEPTEFHEKRVMVKFIVDRFTGEEFLRHRKGSFNRESTRYVNFAKEKFDNGNIKFIRPPWIENNETFQEMVSSMNAEWETYAQDQFKSDWTDLDWWLFALKTIEIAYNELIKRGWQAQQARTVLICAICSPLIKTAFVSDWKHFFNLRALGTTGAPHPQAKELAYPLMEEFQKRKLI